MVPNEYQLVCDVVGPRLKIVCDEEDTRANTFWAVNDGCHEARKYDTNWGLLIKTGGAQVESRAADVWLYNLGNNTAQVVDIVANAEGAAPPEGGPRTAPVPSWGEKDIRQISEWVEPYPRSDGGESGGEGGEGTDTSELAARVAALEEVVQTQGAELEAVQASIGALDERLTTLETTIAQPSRAYGPIDLPVVMDGFSLRTRGDIDVAVTPGEATPPPPPSGGSDLATLVLVKKLIARLRDDDEAPEKGTQGKRR
jgi:hypothetical protein